ncbi:hypothetical protein NAPIS_ORF01716 [Vairimorpha apis BRL 01]|uniref:Uncharacterized protein n=1 Tax=Vairimorpha apis BRL 01 TaxID=1037528 RepID=T0MBZ8_9MICR|nr:hypothetical protein NAPIS_ORF01716 [Vairimorpha apis BRL 01]
MTLNSYKERLYLPLSNKYMLFQLREQLEKNEEIITKRSAPSIFNKNVCIVTHLQRYIKKNLVSKTFYMASFCYIQDRNVFCGATYLATRYVIKNDLAEIKMDTRLKIDIKFVNNRPDIFIFYTMKREIILIEVGITSQDNLQQVEMEKMKKYELLKVFTATKCINKTQEIQREHYHVCYREIEKFYPTRCVTEF